MSFLRKETLLSLGDHQEMANLAVQVSLSNLETIASTMQVSEDQILQYVVKKDATQSQQGDNVQTDSAGTEQSDKPGSSSAAASSTTTDSDKKQHGDETPMEVDSTVPKQNTTSESAQSASTERSFMAAAHPGPARNGRSDVAAAVGGATAAEPVLPNWQAAVPEEWVPVINQDIVRQRRQAPQAPLSDAYLSGMPTKRLKLTQERNVPVSNGMETYVPETLRHAIQTAGVAPRTSMDTVMQEAKEDQQLHRACEEQVRSAVRERLRRDPDYNPQRFPNAEKYFQNKKKK